MGEDNKNDLLNNDLLNTAKIKEDIKFVPIEQEMQKSYLDYAMSVIVSRALPDVRDGLKPVHRRIIYSMYESSYFHNKPYKKSARIVGDVMGKYHPHGDSAIYESMVRMAQNFSLRLPLIDGQGNFGSMDGDNAAAMRYTEARMAVSAEYLIQDLDKETVNFKPNYDDSLEEPVVLPAMYPNILVNGGSGIAVGMATNIPTHNLGELIDALIYMIDNPNYDENDIMNFVKGPDFPTGGRIIGKGAIRQAILTGRGSISICGVARIEDAKKSKSTIIISEIPWQVNKSKLVEEISNLKEKADNKDLDVISAVRDESDRHGVRIVIELKKDVEPEIVINYLQKYTSFQVSFGVNMLAINKGVPKLMNVKEVLVAFLEFRKEVVRKRTIYLLKKAREKAHIFAGLGVAVENLDEVIELIKSSENPAIAKERLLSKPFRAGAIAPYIALLDEVERVVVDGFYSLSESQVRAILELRLHRLTGLEREKIIGDLSSLSEDIKRYLEILSNSEVLIGIVRDEFLLVKEKFATPRRTVIEEKEDDLNEEDFIQKEDMVVTISNNGYIKRVPISTYRSQRRGGKGKVGMATKEHDFVTNVFVINTHDNILFFSSKGIVYRLKCYKIPESQSQSLGRALVNLLPIEKNEIITTVLPLNKEVGEDKELLFVTSMGSVRKNSLKDFLNIPTRGKIAMKLDEGDVLVGVSLVDVNQDVLISTKLGKATRFCIEDLRLFASRNSSGVRGIKLQKNDIVINVSLLNHEKQTLEIREEYLKYATAKRKGEDVSLIDFKLSMDELKDLAEKEQFILTVSSNGYGKIASTYEYRITGRGGSGFINYKISEKNGDVVASFIVEKNDEIIIVSNEGQIIRIPVKGIRTTSRVSAGVILFKMDRSKVSNLEKVVSVSRLCPIDEEDIAEIDENLEDMFPLVDSNEEDSVYIGGDDNIQTEEDEK